MLFAEQLLPDLTTASQALAKLHIEDLLLPVLLQLVVIISVARIAGVVARKLRQPTAVGEIVAGLLLGPSLFGWIFPELSAAIFKPHLEGVPDVLANAAFPKVFAVLAQIGLIWLLFLVGLEFEFTHLKEYGRAAFAISLTGVALPFALGSGLAYLIHPHLEPGRDGNTVSQTGLALFMGVAMSITAIPILGRMMIELGMNRTRVGAITITAAAVDDATGWILLATVAALVNAEYEVGQTLLMIGQTAGFAAVMFFAVRPVLVRYFRWTLSANDGQLGLTPLVVLLVVMLLSAIATSLIGIFAIFGPFVLGAVMSDQVAFREAVSARLRELVSAFFLPIFFTYTGLRTEVRAVNGETMWLICAAVIAAAVVGKFGGCTLAARWSGFRWKEAGIIGVMMNTRALMELIVINVGYDLGVIPQSLFCMLVLMAILTTIITTPILLRWRHGTEIEEPIRRSGFLR